MKSTKEKGNISEAKVLAALIAYGYPVLLPFGDNERYDFVIEQDGEFKRIQVKTAYLIQDGNAISIPVSSSHNHCNGGRKDYKGEVDFIMAYCPYNDKVYKLSIDEVGTSQVALRLSPPQISNSRCRNAIDFEFPPMV